MYLVKCCASDERAYRQLVAPLGSALLSPSPDLLNAKLTPYKDASTPTLVFILLYFSIFKSA